MESNEIRKKDWKLVNKETLGWNVNGLWEGGGLQTPHVTLNEKLRNGLVFVRPQVTTKSHDFDFI